MYLQRNVSRQHARDTTNPHRPCQSRSRPWGRTPDRTDCLIIRAMYPLRHQLLLTQQVLHERSSRATPGSRSTASPTAEEVSQDTPWRAPSPYDQSDIALWRRASGPGCSRRTARRASRRGGEAPDGTNLRKSGLRPRAHGDRGLLALGSFHERRGLPVGRR